MWVYGVNVSLPKLNYITLPPELDGVVGAGTRAGGGEGVGAETGEL